MNYLLHASLSCCLAMSSTVVVAGGNTKNPLVTSGEHSAISQDLPSIHLAVGGPWEKAHQQVLIDGFWPFFQQEQQLLFLQGGWLRQQQQQQQQQRNLLSAGLGWRYFPETDWGVGSNLFYDQDLTRQHRRIGLGAEAWWQSLTLTANGYLPASSWRTARDLKEIRERPAQGYDVTLKGYLPAVPHLGASVRYARYFGDEVAVGSSQQRHRNPKQWRWGVDVTPIPLLTLAYHHQPGLSSHDKHQISAALTYRFSLPLSQQLDPRQVTLLHSAEGQRLARVQRDQLMVLQYAKIAAPIEKPLPPAVAPITKAEPEGDSEAAPVEPPVESPVLEAEAEVDSEVDSEVALIEQRAAASAGPETGLDAGLEIADFTEQRLPLALTPETGSEVGSDAGSDAGTEASPSSTERLSKDPLIVAPSPVVPKTVRLVGPLLPVETTRLIAEQQLASQYQPPIQSPTVDQTQVLALLPKPDLSPVVPKTVRLVGPLLPVETTRLIAEQQLASQLQPPIPVHSPTVDQTQVLALLPKPDLSPVVPKTVRLVGPLLPVETTRLIAEQQLASQLQPPIPVHLPTVDQTQVLALLPKPDLSPVVPKTVRLVGPLLPVETTRLIAEQQLASQLQPPIPVHSPTVDQTQVLALLPKPDLSPVVPKTVRLVGPLLPVETTRLIAEQQLASQYQPPIQSPTVDQTQVLALLPKPDLRRQLLQALRLAAEPKLAGPSSPVDQIPVLEPNLEQQHLTKQLHNRRPKQARHKHKHR